jgi:hypothetical protein
VIASDIFFNGRSAALARLALLHRLPAVYQVREFPVAGGLMSYGDSFAQSHSQAGVYVGRILKGEKPARDLSCNGEAHPRTADHAGQAALIGVVPIDRSVPAEHQE